MTSQVLPENPQAGHKGYSFLFASFTCCSVAAISWHMNMVVPFSYLGLVAIVTVNVKES